MMKKIGSIIFMLALYSFAQAQLLPTRGEEMKGMDIDKKAIDPALVKYTCPMHPEVHANKLGNCPKCGMKLIKDKTIAVKKVTEKKDAAVEMPIKGSPAKEPAVSKAVNNLGKMDMAASPKVMANTTAPKTVHYDLYIRDTMVNFSGKAKRAIAVNGQIPMPTLTFTEGDTAEIVVHNELNESTSLHWHGLLLPNRYDGVPNLTQMPIKPHTTHLYRFAIIQHGTHWYHSHSGLQEQIGMYGSFVMNKRVPSPSEVPINSHRRQVN